MIKFAKIKDFRKFNKGIAGNYGYDLLFPYHHYQKIKDKTNILILADKKYDTNYGFIAFAKFDTKNKRWGEFNFVSNQDADLITDIIDYIDWRY